MKIVNIDGENFISSELLEEFHWHFQKSVTYDNIKSNKKLGFTLSLEDTFFKKPEWGVKLSL